MLEWSEVPGIFQHNELRTGNDRRHVFGVFEPDRFVMVSDHNRCRHVYLLELLARPVWLAVPHTMNIGGERNFLAQFYGRRLVTYRCRRHRARRRGDDWGFRLQAINIDVCRSGNYLAE